jgi:diguanylate cyclase (GGDEF)-like protein
MHVWQRHSEQAARRINLKTGLVWGSSCALLVALVWGAAAFKIDLDEQRLIDQLKIDNQHRSRTHAEQLLRAVSQIDQLSTSIKYQWERHATPLDLEEQYRRGVYRESLYPVALDANGYALTSTRNLARGTFLGDLEFFTHTRDSNITDLLIAQPTEGRGGFSGKKIIRFSRRVNKADGSFGGAVLIAVESGYLVSFPDVMHLPAGDFVSVRFVDGGTLASRGGGNGRSSFYTAPVSFDAAEGTRLEPPERFVDQQARIVSWNRIDNYPLILVEASSVANALLPYESTRSTYYLIASMVSALLLVAALFGATMQIRHARQRRHQAQVQSTFRLAVDAAREAFYMIRPLDTEPSEWILEDCNERAAEMQQRSRIDLIGHTLNQLLTGRELAHLRRFCAQVLDEGFLEEEFHVTYGQQHVAGWFQRRGVRSGAGIAVTVRDVSDSRQQAETLANMARTDALTGLPNRHWLNEYLPGTLQQAQHDGRKLALLYIDIDNFKHINDTLGHRAGDDVLVAVAGTLRSVLKQGDHLARIGGDEFTVLLEDLGADALLDAGRIADRLIAAIGHMSAGSAWRAFNLRASIGISLFPDHGRDIDALLLAADVAMYEAKSAGKAQFQHYDEIFAQKIRERISIEHALELAIKRDEFVIYYQPRADAKNGVMTGMEALIRWRHTERGLLSPTEFIAVAEQTGLIVPIGERVIQKVCAQLASWRRAGLAIRPVSINVSALQLTNDGLRQSLASNLEAHGLSASLIAIELTESSMLDKEGVAQDELRKLREMGIELEIDDFGTGYSSLSKLQSLAIDVLKIDQSFVRRVGHDTQANALCQTMVSIGRSLNISVVAEGVETEEQLDQLRRMGCDQIQGYLISPPLPPEKLPALFDLTFFEPVTASA